MEAGTAPSASGLTDEQTDFVDAIRDFAEREKFEMPEDDHHSDEVAAKMAELGWYGLQIDEQYGGSGGSFLDACLFLEEVARGQIPIGGYGVTLIVVGALNKFGTEEQKAEHLGHVTKGGTLAIAMSEPDSGSDVASLKCKARLEDGEWVLSGAKMWCSYAHKASHTLIVCRTEEGSERHEGLSMIFVPHDAEGFTITPIDTMGGRETNELHLDDVRVPESALLGTAGNGWIQLMSGLNYERTILAASAVGMAQRAFDDTLEYVKERKQFGRPVGSFQVLQARLADLATELIQARLLVRHVARLTDEDPTRMLPQEASMAKLAATELAKKVALEAVQMGGGYGYATEYPMERHLRGRGGDHHLRRHVRDPAQHHRQDAGAVGHGRRGRIIRGYDAHGSDLEQDRSPKEHQRRLGSARDAMLAVTRLLSPDGDLQAPDAVRERLVNEAREFFGVRRVVLLRTEGADRLRILACSPAARIPRGTIGVDEFPVLRDPAENDTVAFASGDAALALDTALGSMDPARSLLALPMQIEARRGHILVLADAEGRTFADEEVQVAQAFAAATSATLAQLRMAGERAVQIAQQAALARAAKTLNESLDLNRVLVRISHEAASILDADNAIVYRGERRGRHGRGGHLRPAAGGHRLPDAHRHRAGRQGGRAGPLAADQRLPGPARPGRLPAVPRDAQRPGGADALGRRAARRAVGGLPPRSRGHAATSSSCWRPSASWPPPPAATPAPTPAWCWPPAPTG